MKEFKLISGEDEAAVNFPSPGESISYYDDPLEELINEFNEFADVLDEDERELEMLKLKKQDFIEEGKLYRCNDIEELLSYFDKQLSILSDSVEQVQYCMDEIEFHIPKKAK